MTADLPLGDGEAPARVRAAVLALDDAFNRGNVDGVLAFYSPDAVMVVQPGQLAIGHAALRAVFETLIHQGGNVKVLASEVLVAGDTALLIARWSIRRPQEHRPATHTATSVLRQGADGSWRLLVDNAFGPGVLDRS